MLSRPPAFILSQDQTLRVVEFFWLSSSSFHSALKAGFLTLTFFSLFAILSSAFAFTLYLNFFDEVNSALSFQTILFSRFSFLPLFGGSVNRFSSGALLMYQLSPELSSVLRKYFKVFFEAIHCKGFGLSALLGPPLADSSLGQGAAS